MTTFFTSDQHFGHANLIKHSYRPFETVDAMNETLVDRFNARVHDDDETYHLGDFALDMRLVKDFLPRLRGKHHLIAGNHDACHPHHSKWRAAADKYKAWGFATIIGGWADLAEVPGLRMCHLPFAGDRSEADRLPAHRPPREGCTWLLHGHVHEIWRRKENMLNIGVDQHNFAPISLDEALEMLRDE
jgi:calcineurin-like phosphoesterase family protein